MIFHRRQLMPLDDRGPMRVMFINTCLPVGGAETLLVELVRRFDRSRFSPELCCLKHLGPLGEILAREVPAYTGLLANKWDFRVLPRLVRLIRQQRIDAVITVGTGGDRMFWGRLAAKIAGVPVICSALHSTGLPDHVELPNRLLQPLTDAFVAVANSHADYLAKHEGCPTRKIRVVPNGVDVNRFRRRRPSAVRRRELDISQGSPVVAIVAALRPEKNHELFLEAATQIHRREPETVFLVVGDGPRRAMLEKRATELGLGDSIRFTGTRSDVAELLSLVDVLVLSSQMEANPVSILEAMAAERPVVATRVGSVAEAVLDGVTGYLVDPGSAEQIAEKVGSLLADPNRAAAMGREGRRHVLEHGSCQQMVRGYQDMIAEIYTAKQQAARKPRHTESAAAVTETPTAPIHGR